MALGTPLGHAGPSLVGGQGVRSNTSIVRKLKSNTSILRGKKCVVTTGTLVTAVLRSIDTHFHENRLI